MRLQSPQNEHYSQKADPSRAYILAHYKAYFYHYSVRVNSFYSSYKMRVLDYHSLSHVEFHILGAVIGIQAYVERFFSNITVDGILLGCFIAVRCIWSIITASTLSSLSTIIVLFTPSTSLILL